MQTSVLPIINPPTGKDDYGIRSYFEWGDSPHLHLFTTGDRYFMFLPVGSRVYEISDTDYDSLNKSISAGDNNVVQHLAEVGLLRDMPDATTAPSHVYSMSLAVAQACNLGCSYCYAEQGSFGRPATNMSREVAFQAVDRLVEQVRPGQKFNLAFMGGEPLLNRKLIRETTEYAARRAHELRIEPTFSITTNGTLVNENDAQFFESHRFSVTLSVDGIGDAHDRLRSHKSGNPSFDLVMARANLLFSHARGMQVSARVTVTPLNTNCLETLDTLIDAGFHSVGFSPMLASPNGRHEMQKENLENYLVRMMECGERFRSRLLAGERYPFSNMVTALEQLHRGTCSPFPCGAGRGYFGVAANGDLSACHRFVGDDAGAMGTLGDGVDLQKQGRWLNERHVDSQQPCSGCWARYLCGGGCHHEVINRGRPACDYIRDWLTYCLGVYADLQERLPDYFEA